MRGSARWFLPAVGLVAVAGLVVPADGSARRWLTGLLFGFGAGAIGTSLARRRPPRPMLWVLLLFSQVAFAVGAVSDLPAGLIGYPLLAVSLVAFARRRSPGNDLAALLDGLIILVGLAAASWVIIVHPALSDVTGGWRPLLDALSRPLGDLLVLAAVTWLWTDRGRRSPSYLLLLGGVGTLLVTDALARVSGAAAAVTLGTAGLVGCLGLAALHPGMVELDRPQPAPVLRITRLRFAVLLALAALLVPVLALLQGVPRAGVDIRPLAGLEVVLFGLVVTRMSGLVGALGRMHRRESVGRFHRLTQHSSDVIIVCDRGGVVRYLTPSVERVFGWPVPSVQGLPITDFVHPDDVPALRPLFAALPGGNPTAPTRCRVRSAAGQWVTAETVATWLTDDELPGYLLTVRDVTDHVRLEEELTHQALHDALTGLANRALFLEHVRHGLERRNLVFRSLALLLLDLDDFKTINDSLGPDTGDELLRAVAERLRGCLRSADTAARLGGDEFALLVEEIGDPAEAAQVATRLLAALEKPLLVGGRQIVVHASIGIAIADVDTVAEPTELLRNADVAMYTAKRHGRDRYAFFTPSMHAGLVERLDLTDELRTAVANHGFTVYYQPIVSLPDGVINGVEALVRWPHPDRELVSPADFIPLAEETGLIVPLGAAVLIEACTQVARWRLERPDLDLSVSVNLSPRQVHDPAIVKLVRDALRAADLPPYALTLEITESLLMEDAKVAMERLAALKELGVRLAVDDFGTGYSSLSRLHRLPIDILKIPKPFVDGVAGGPTASALARAILELAAALDLSVVAEGIEQLEQAQVLDELGCPFAQGYHFGRPVPADELAELLSPQPVVLPG